MYYFWLGKDAEVAMQEIIDNMRAKRRIGYMYGDIWYV